jgi:Ser/Thr protein kinase RdoA (MazF antagonist)
MQKPAKGVDEADLAGNAPRSRAHSGRPRVGGGDILKLFHNWFSLEDIEYEQMIARAVHASGVKSPEVRELIQVEGRNGLVYERVAGVSMLEMFQRKPWRVVPLGRTLAELHAQMHECVFEAEVPDQRSKLERKINRADALPTPLKTALLTSLHSLPEGDRVCHGDFHPANVLMDGNDAVSSTGSTPHAATPWRMWRAPASSSSARRRVRSCQIRC